MTERPLFSHQTIKWEKVQCDAIAKWTKKYIIEWQKKKSVRMSVFFHSKSIKSITYIYEIDANDVWNAFYFIQYGKSRKWLYFSGINELIQIDKIIIAGRSEASITNSHLDSNYPGFFYFFVCSYFHLHSWSIVDNCHTSYITVALCKSIHRLKRQTIDTIRYDTIASLKLQLDSNIHMSYKSNLAAIMWIIGISDVSFGLCLHLLGETHANTRKMLQMTK